MSRRRAGAARVAAALTALVLALVTACTDEPTPPGNIPTGATSAAPSEPPSTSEAPQTDEEQIIAVWKKWFELLVDLKSPTDDDIIQAFSPYGTQNAVGNVVAGYQQLRAKGREFGGYVVFGPIEVTVTEEAASLVECRDGSSEKEIDMSTGAVIRSGMPGARIDASFVRQNGAWLVETYTVQAQGC